MEWDYCVKSQLIIKKKRVKWIVEKLWKLKAIHISKGVWKVPKYNHTTLKIIIGKFALETINLPFKLI